MSGQVSRFRAASAEAVLNERLIAAVRHTADLLVSKREAAVSSMPDYETARARVKKMRLEALDHIEENVSRFAAQAQKAGAVVHHAADASEASAIAVGIATGKGVRSAVKTKSMTSEEAGLNEALEDSGIEVTETDLGEFIIQLAGEKPSHIMAPAIHKNRSEVADLFARKTGAEPGLGVEGLVAHARKVLRKKFLEAELGITGANFAVAETGTVVIVTNEGNGRMCTTLPPLQIVLLGIDKIVPELADLPELLMLLTRSASGQPISSYVSMTTGPALKGEEEGPRELHIILMDNGRRKMVRGPYREMANCLHCGACLSHCPVYRAVGGHAYGSVYSGPMGSVLSPLLFGKKDHAGLPWACTLCGRCAEICPASIPLPDYLRKLRGEVTEPGLKAGLASRLAANPALYLLGIKMMRRLLASGGRFVPLMENWKVARHPPQPGAGPGLRDRVPGGGK